MQCNAIAAIQLQWEWTNNNGAATYNQQCLACICHLRRPLLFCWSFHFVILCLPSHSPRPAFASFRLFHSIRSMDKSLWLVATLHQRPQCKWRPFEWFHIVVRCAAHTIISLCSIRASGHKRKKMLGHSFSFLLLCCVRARVQCGWCAVRNTYKVSFEH